MINKEVKEYSNRKRININNDDNLNPGDKVIIFTTKEYDDFKQDFLDLQNELIAIEKENQILKSQEQNLKEIIKNVTAPIYENHKKELQDKEDLIKQLNNELNLLKVKCNQYNLELQGLNLIDIAILRKHKRLIKNFNENLTAIVDDPKIIDADARAIPGDKKLSN